MKRVVCILGDSHATGFRRLMRPGEPQCEHADRFRVDYFASSSRISFNMGMMRAAADGCLEPTNALLKESLEERFAESRVAVKGYDAICLVGLRLEFPYKLVNDYYHHKLELKKMYSSERMFVDAQRDLIAGQSLAIKLAREIRKIDPAMPLFVIPNPLISSQLRTVSMGSLLGMVPREMIPPVRFFKHESWHEWRAILEQVFAELNVEFLYQPDETVEDSIFTARGFALSEEHDGGLRHMNSDYWRRLYAQLLARLHARLEGAPAGR